MAITDYKITTGEVNSNHVKNAPNVLTGTAQTNKNYFDKLPELIVSKHNNLIDAIGTDKQDTLVSGTNIKTVNSKSLLGSGNVAVQPTLVSGTNIKTVNSTSLLGSGNISVQPTLVSGTNIKTINNNSILGSGNVALQPTLVSGTNIKTVNSTSLLGSGNVSVQPTLVSGTNIKTINSQSLLGSGNIDIQGSVVDVTVNGTSVVDQDGSAEIPCVNSSRSGVLPPAGSVSETGEYKVYTDAYGIGEWKTVPLSLNSSSDAPARSSAVAYELNRKQDTLVSGTNIKTINNNSILGSGDITIGGDALYDYTSSWSSPSLSSDSSVGRMIYGDISSLTPTDLTKIRAYIADNNDWYYQLQVYAVKLRSGGVDVWVRNCHTAAVSGTLYFVLPFEATSDSAAM